MAQIKITQTSNADMNIGIPKNLTMAQQTAMMQLLKYILVDCRNENGTIQFHAHETFNKFLQMEKEQIIKAGDECQIYNDGWVYEDGEQYYNQTYQSNKG
jgi:hypothetical protein